MGMFYRFSFPQAMLALQQIAVFAAKWARGVRSRTMRALTCVLFMLALTGSVLIRAEEEKPAPVSGEERSRQMVAGIDCFLMRKIDESVASREAFWQRDFSSTAAYAKSVEPNRSHLREILGVCDADQRTPVSALELLSTTDDDSVLAETKNYTVQAVRWPVLAGISGEGLLLRPKGKIRARIIVLPDADQTPEMLAGLAEGVAAGSRVALRLVQLGCEVVVPALVNRGCEYSGNAAFDIRTNVPHREWIYRMSFETGRHIIGYELEKVFALVDWMEAEGSNKRVPIAVAGYGEGGLLALNAAALDTRIKASLVSGYFRSRNRVWEEPIYRNVFGLLREFGDAEIATLISPRMLVVEHSDVPHPAELPPLPAGGRLIAAPGVIRQPEAKQVIAEVQRAKTLMKGHFGDSIRLVIGEQDSTMPMFSIESIQTLLATFDIEALETRAPTSPPRTEAALPNAAQRQERMVAELEAHAQRAIQACEEERKTKFWSKLPLDSVAAFAEATAPSRRAFAEDVIGTFNDPVMPMNAKSEQVFENEAFRVYDVTLEIWPDVFAWGSLLLPKDIRRDEKRPVVVCQHGLEGLPEDVWREDEGGKAWKSYKGFAAQLARHGFITFAPHNPYRGKDDFRVLQRKLNPLGKTLFSIINAQHRCILDWLGTRPFVDRSRIAFYGLSYGGKSAMRIPAALDGYCLSICSGDFNEWIRKTSATDLRMSYLYTGEYEIWEWNMARTGSYAEMAALVAPRPFMVERGHDDGVGTDEWVDYEFAKVRRLYDKLGIGDRTAIEHFNGPHTIHGVGTFEFLHRQLGWPAR
jgi:dienelactone hydrolase